MPTWDDPMIIATFTYRLLEGELFQKLVGGRVGQCRRNDMKSQSIPERRGWKCRKSKNGRKGRGGKSKKGRANYNVLVSTKGLSRHYKRRPHQSERRGWNDRYQPYRQEAYEAYTPQSPSRHNPDKNRKYPRDPNKYCDFHKKLGHAAEDCESLRREKEKKWSWKVDERAMKRDDTPNYDAKNAMV